MDALTLFGLFAVTVMLLCYALEDRGPGWVLAFAASCLLGSAYGFLQGAWPFGIVELIWAATAAHRWHSRRNPPRPPEDGTESQGGRGCDVTEMHARPTPKSPKT